MNLLKEKVDNLCKIIGLDGCKDTYLGGAMVKGCSGGEKRRVTVGEALLGFHKIILLDKFSTGLDSAITKDITKFLRDYAVELNNIIICAMIQPDPEIISLFDQLIVLEEGNVIYCGKTSEAIHYFNSLGFELLGDTDIGSFLSNIGNSVYRKELLKSIAIRKNSSQNLSKNGLLDYTTAELNDLLSLPSFISQNKEDKPPSLKSFKSKHGLLEFDQV